MSVVHTEGDKKIDWRELSEAQRELRAHSRALARIFNIGRGQGRKNAARCYDNLSSWANDAPILRCVAKTHKPVGDDGVPKSRPICGAATGMTTPVSEILSDILEPLTRTVEDSVEAQSTEELLRKIEETNNNLDGVNQEDVAVGSMDVTALYPNIDQAIAAKIVKEMFVESDLEIEEVD